ncbi:hypothetical protein BDZ97DRAFT_1760089 [Flammula alnicola]|nr:hypothetical protein BDZ97DRAFT_1760089 [Flammula alnicola]
MKKKSVSALLLWFWWRISGFWVISGLWPGFWTFWILDLPGFWTSLDFLDPFSELGPETPPNTPQRVRIAAQRLERNSRILESPQIHRTHQPQPRVPRIEPLHFNIPVPPPVPAVAAAIAAVNNDPFGVHNAPLAVVNFNGRQYAHLPADLAQRLAALPAMPAASRHVRNRNPPMPLPAVIPAVSAALRRGHRENGPPAPLPPLSLPK